mmetsp:Transcript_34949/g.100657  ORF Transcript_34949/g.100657 Transcript_34949/m.100657 type:complete len:367 (+) Transcript_34949:57-1157(+)
MQLLVVLAGLVATSAEELAADSRSCTEHSMDDAVLLQQKTKMTDTSQPDFGLNHLVREVRGDVDGPTTAKPHNVSSGSFIAVGDIVNTTLLKLQAMMDKYALAVNGSSGNIRNGLSAIIVETREDPASAQDASAQDKQHMLQSMSQAEDTLNALLLSIDAVSKVVESIPARVPNATHAVDLILANAKTRCRDLTAAIGSFGRMVQDVASKRGKEDLRISATSIWSEMLHIDSTVGLLNPDIVVNTGGAEVEERIRREVSSRLSGPLNSLQQNLVACSKSFEDGFQTLSAHIDELARQSLSSEAADAVSGALAGVPGAAKSVAAKSNIAFGQFLESIRDASAIPNAGLGLRPGLFVVALLARMLSAV